MNRYTVVWMPDVEEELLEAWLAAGSAEKDRLTRASHAIDRELAIDPQWIGQVMPAVPTLKAWELPGVSPPITDIFKVNPGDRIVRVLRVIVASE